MHEMAKVVEEVTHIAKIVRKKIRFWILQMKPLESRTCKECEKKNVTNLQMKTHIRDNHAEYWKFETIGGLFQINATNVRNRQFVEDILANTEGQSMRMCSRNWENMLGALKSKLTKLNELWKKSVCYFQMKCRMITKRSLRKMFVFMQQMWENSWRWIQGDRRKKSFLDFTDENMWRTFMAATNEKM